MFLQPDLVVVNIMWLKAGGRQFSLWAALPLFGGVLAAWKLSERSCPFLHFKSSSYIKVYKQESQSFRLLCTRFSILIPIFCLERRSPSGKYLMQSTVKLFIE